MRQDVEIDLPTRFAQHYGSAIDVWLESAIPGSTLLIPTFRGPPVLLSSFVSCNAIERNTVTLKATELKGGALLVEAADAHSKRLIIEEVRYLEGKKAEEDLAAVVDTVPTVPGTIRNAPPIGLQQGYPPHPFGSIL